jgi:hypothetical protein
MEITCNRCHQPIREESCYCPTCGLPQLVYATAEGEGAAPAERWNEAVRDASEVEWKAALRAALLLAIPAGLLCGFLPTGMLGFIWIAAAAAWAVSIYVRKQKAAWITLGAGARIGLVTGLIASWLAFSAGGAGIFAERFAFHRAEEMDRTWRTQIQESGEITQRLMSQIGMFDPAEFKSQQEFEMSPEGRAGLALLSSFMGSVVLLLFAVAGGAVGARMTAGRRRPQA